MRSNRCEFFRSADAPHPVTGVISETVPSLVTVRPLDRGFFEAPDAIENRGAREIAMVIHVTAL